MINVSNISTIVRLMKNECRLMGGVQILSAPGVLRFVIGVVLLYYSIY